MIIYIWGNLTSDNFTPRPGKDTVAAPGQKPGLSASQTIPAGRKVQGLDTDKFKDLLRAFPDEPKSGGVPDHFTIAPVDGAGEVDFTKLEAWAKTRGSGQIHEFTQILLDAVVEPNIKGSSQ